MSEPNLQQQYDTVGQSSAARPFSVVIRSNGQGQSQPGGRENTVQGVAKAKCEVRKNEETEERIKKGRRQQPPREKKPLQSIEYSPQRTDVSCTPYSSTDEAESDYIPPSTDLPDANLSSAPNTPPRRKPHKHSSSSSPNAGSTVVSRSTPGPSRLQRSPHESGMLTVGNREKLLDTGSKLAPRSPSLSLWISQVSDEILEEDGCVELPPMIYHHMRNEKEIRRMERKVIRAKEKERLAKKISAKGKSESTQKTGKEKAGNTVEHDGMRKQQQSEAPQKQASNVHAVARDDKVLGEISRTSKQTGAPRSMQSHTSEQKRLHNERRSCAEPFERREVALSENPRCTCSMLPDYFTENPKRNPRLEKWHGSESEFFEHVKQISSCPGAIHPQHVIGTCKKIVEESDYFKRSDNDCLVSMSPSAKKGLSTNSQKDSNLWRAQSSIPPREFYGDASRHQPKSVTVGSLQGVSQVDKEAAPAIIIPTPARAPKDVSNFTSPRAPPSRDTSRKATNPATGPNSSPLGKKSKVDMTNHLSTLDDSPSENENFGAKRKSKPLQEAPSIPNQPQSSFDAQRQRCQSVPVNTVSLSGASNEQMPPALPALRQHRNQVSNNVICQRLDAFEKVLEERLPASSPAQNADNQPPTAPAPAPASAPDVPVQDGNTAEQPTSDKRKRRREGPGITYHVPMDLRLSDEELIKIGRNTSGYGRHEGAHYAFNKRGRLTSEYDHLLKWQGSTSVPDWTAKEIRRVLG